MQIRSVKSPNKNVHAKDQPHKIWKRNEQQITPTKIEACMVSGGAYGWIMDCMQIIKNVAILESFNRIKLHDFVALSVVVAGHYFEMMHVRGGHLT